MAVRRLIQDTYVVPAGAAPDRFPKAAVLVTYLKRARWCDVMLGETPMRLHYHDTEYVHPAVAQPAHLINDAAMLLYHQPSTRFLRQELWRHPNVSSYCEVIVGDALLTNPAARPHRYARVVTLNEEGWEPQDFEEWVEMNFEDDPHAPSYVGNNRETFAYCEDPDPKARDIKLAMARLRFG